MQPDKQLMTPFPPDCNEGSTMSTSGLVFQNKSVVIQIWAPRVHNNYSAVTGN